MPRNEEGEPLLDSQELDDYSCSQDIGTDFPDVFPIITAVKQRNNERISTQESERDTIVKLSKKIFKNKSVKSLPDIGSRLQKYWFKINTKTVNGIQITVKLSNQCKLNIEDTDILDLLKSFFSHLQYPYLLHIHDVAYRDGYVGILQDYIPTGSIRDYIYEVAPDQDWIRKYNTSEDNQCFDYSEVAKCGHDILKAVEVLYSIGFEYVGQIHSGNVFIANAQYVLGGFENTLLGYRSSCFARLQRESLVDKMDVIMFGHLMFEMITGSSVITDRVILSRQDYKNIEHSDTREFIQFIFECTKEKNSSSRGLLQLIASHDFLENFQSHATPPLLPLETQHLVSSVFSEDLNLDAVIHKLDGKYSLLSAKFLKLGWRTGKLWAKVQNKHIGEGLLTAFIVPNSCPIYVSSSIKEIKELLFMKHDNVAAIRDVDYITVGELHVVVIFQDWIEMGSMKDKIHQCRPLKVWYTKYKKTGKKLKVTEVRQFGGQILQAMMYWSSLLGEDQPLTLGHIHTGNIFVSGDTCRVGGFENTLLGFTTRKFKLFDNYQDRLDVFMFGHVIYEMCTGMELQTAIPTESDLKKVPKELRQVFYYIFYNASENLQTISEHLQVTPLPMTTAEIPSANAKYVLRKVRKGKVRNQNDEAGKTKFKGLHKLI